MRIEFEGMTVRRAVSLMLATVAVLGALALWFFGSIDIGERAWPYEEKVQWTDNDYKGRDTGSPCPYSSLKYQEAHCTRHAIGEIDDSAWEKAVRRVVGTLLMGLFALGAGGVTKMVRSVAGTIEDRWLVDDEGAA